MVLDCVHTCRAVALAKAGADIVLDGIIEPAMVISMPEMDTITLTLALVAALCIGLSKAGFSGISMVSVFLLADLYGAKESVGLGLPLLILADLLAYPAFIKYGSWKPVWRLLAPTMVGILAGWWMLSWIDNDTARRVIGICILLMVVLQSSRRLHPEWFDACVAHRGFGASAGVVGGFATMLANAAGPVIQLFLLARRMPKMELIGVGARFFLLINIIKVPFGAQLDLINAESLLINLKVAPAVVVGVFGGRWLVDKVSQRLFEWMVVVFSIAAGVRLLFF